MAKLRLCSLLLMAFLFLQKYRDDLVNCFQALFVLPIKRGVVVVLNRLAWLTWPLLNDWLELLGVKGEGMLVFDFGPQNFHEVLVCDAINSDAPCEVRHIGFCVPANRHTTTSDSY